MHIKQQTKTYLDNNLMCTTVIRTRYFCDEPTVDKQCPGTGRNNKLLYLFIADRYLIGLQTEEQRMTQLGNNHTNVLRSYQYKSFSSIFFVQDCV